MGEWSHSSESGQDQKSGPSSSAPPQVWLVGTWSPRHLAFFVSFPPIMVLRHSWATSPPVVTRRSSLNFSDTSLCLSLPLSHPSCTAYTARCMHGTTGRKRRAQLQPVQPASPVSPVVHRLSSPFAFPTVVHLIAPLRLRPVTRRILKFPTAHAETTETWTLVPSPPRSSIPSEKKKKKKKAKKERMRKRALNYYFSILFLDLG